MKELLKGLLELSLIILLAVISFMVSNIAIVLTVVIHPLRMLINFSKTAPVFNIITFPIILLEAPFILIIGVLCSILVGLREIIYSCDDSYNHKEVMSNQVKAEHLLNEKSLKSRLYFIMISARGK